MRVGLKTGFNFFVILTLLLVSALALGGEKSKPGRKRPRPGAAVQNDVPSGCDAEFRTPSSSIENLGRWNRHRDLNESRAHWTKIKSLVEQVPAAAWEFWAASLKEEAELELQSRRAENRAERLVPYFYVGGDLIDESIRKITKLSSSDQKILAAHLKAVLPVQDSEPLSNFGNIDFNKVELLLVPSTVAFENRKARRASVPKTDGVAAVNRLRAATALAQQRLGPGVKTYQEIFDVLVPVFTELDEANRDAIREMVVKNIPVLTARNFEEGLKKYSIKGAKRIMDYLNLQPTEPVTASVMRSVALRICNIEISSLLEELEGRENGAQ